MFPSDDSFRSLPIPSVYTMKMRSLKIPSVDPSVPFRVHDFSFREKTTSTSNSRRLFRNMIFPSMAENKGVILRAQVFTAHFTWHKEVLMNRHRTMIEFVLVWCRYRFHRRLDTESVRTCIPNPRTMNPGFWKNIKSL